MTDETKPTEALPAAGSDHLMVQQFRLRVLSGDDAGLVYEMTKPRATVGTRCSRSCAV